MNRGGAFGTGPAMPQGQVGRPGTGARGAPPVVRPATGQRRLGTAAARNPDMPVGLVTSVQVQDRPVTKHGMSGMRSAAPVGGSRRVIADANYYVAELRAKIRDIQEETGRLESEVEHRHQASTNSAQLERKHEITEKEVIELEKQLADLNLLVERVRNDATEEDLQGELDLVKSRNDAERQRLDGVFAERSNKEQNIRLYEEQVAAAEAEQEARVEELGHEKRVLYQQLRNDLNSFMAELSEKEVILRDLQLQLKDLEDQLSEQPGKLQIAELREELQQIEDRTENLDTQKSHNERSVPEEREMLLQQVKSINQEIAMLEQQIVDAEVSTGDSQKEKQEVESQIAEYGSEKISKYRELLAREKEMDKFLTSYDETHAKDIENLRLTEERIVMLLSHVSNEIRRADAVPTLDRAKFTEMQEDLEFKQQQADMARQTVQQLQSELRDRQKEVDRLGDLDKRVESELKALAKKIKNNQEELERFEDIDKLKEEGKQRWKELVKLRESFQRCRQSAEHQIKALNATYEATRQALSTNDQANELEAMEQSLRHVLQNNFIVGEFISNKTNEHDYGPTKEFVSKLVADLNSQTVDGLSLFKTLI